MYIVVAARADRRKSYVHEHVACKLSDVAATVDEWTARFARMNLQVAVYDSSNTTKPLVEFDLENRWIFDIWHECNATI